MWKSLIVVSWAATCVPVSNTGFGVDGYGLHGGEAQVTAGAGASLHGGGALGSVEVGISDRVSLRAEAADFGNLTGENMVSNATVMWRATQAEARSDVVVLGGGGVGWTEGFRQSSEGGSFEGTPDGRYYFPNVHAGWLVSRAFRDRYRVYGGSILAVQTAPPRSDYTPVRVRPQLALGGSLRPVQELGLSAETVAELSGRRLNVGAALRVHLVLSRRGEAPRPAEE